jgi:DNA topoisomerase-3
MSEADDEYTMDEEPDTDEDLVMPGIRSKRTKAEVDRPTGDGPCPKCGAPTRFIPEGKHGPFHGCTRYPDCRGTRGASEDEASDETDNNAWKKNRRMPKELEA